MSSENESEKKYLQKKKTLLILSLIFDIIGMLTYLIPGLGEAIDFIWAPIAGFANYVMFGGTLGIFGGIFSFLEEILPLIDFIPSFTIIWLIKYVIFEQKTKTAFLPEKT